MAVIKQALKSKEHREEEKEREMKWISNTRSGLRVGEDNLLVLAGLLGQSKDVSRD